MQSPFLPGDVVAARGTLWRLRDLTEHRDCVALDLSPAETTAPGHELVLLHPFDRVDRARRTSPRLCSRRRFWRAMARRVLALEPCDVLAAPAAADIDLLPFQLEPALASVLDGAPRVLLADAVGLGKTIQAGLLLAELFVRGAAQRALVLVPSSLRDQWAHELRARFRLDALVVDHARLADLASRLPALVSPWSVAPVSIVSVDFAKRPEVCAALADVRWDVLVVDEAHLATRDSDRFRVVQQIGERAGRVVLITATPHSGHEGEYAALTRLGAAGPDDGLVIFRRSRGDVGLPADRRTRRLGVRPRATERATLRLLAAYTRELWTTAMPADRPDARLVAILLLKRASSTPYALGRTVARRRALLLAGDRPPAAQPLLPFEDPDDAVADEVSEWLLARPGLPSAAREVEWLDQIEAAAALAARDASKVLALARWIRRAHEPCVVFTEYRDTIDELERELGRVARCATLHGGLSRNERAVSLQRFASGEADLLLATDTAGTGLNLHHRCRAVIHLEPPWNPVRLEQRAGRVDRIGQTRRVHVLHLYGRGTPETRLLARVMERARRAGAALGDPVEAPASGPHDEESLAEMWLGLRVSPATAPPLPPRAGRATPGARLLRVDLAQAAARSTRDARTRRRLSGRLLEPHDRRPTDGRQHRARGGPLVRIGRADRHRGGLPSLAGQSPGSLLVFQFRLVDWRRHLVDEQLIVLHATPAWLRISGWSHESLDALVRGLCADVDIQAVLARTIAERVAAASVVVERRLTAGRGRARVQHERERRALAADAAYQAGLFERRAERAAAGRASSPGWRANDEIAVEEPRTRDLVTLAAPPELCALWLPGRH